METDARLTLAIKKLHILRSDSIPDVGKETLFFSINYEVKITAKILHSNYISQET